MHNQNGQIKIREKYKKVKNEVLKIIQKYRSHAFYT